MKMREILYRGKRIDNGKWIIGYYIVVDGISYIFPEKYFGIVEVDPSTVGQYTGLPDRKGKRIFDGDIIQRKGYIYPNGKQEPCGERIVRGVVIWMDDGRNAGCWCIDSNDEHGNQTTYCFDNSYIVVGNVHDNPELLEKKE